jgi:hypothetical protein
MTPANPFHLQLLTAYRAACLLHPDIAHFTVFDGENVYRPNPTDLLELVSAAGLDGETELSKIVCYLPRRQAFHWTMVYSSLFATVADSSHLERVVNTLYTGSVLPQIGDVLALADRRRTAISAEIRDYVSMLAGKKELPRSTTARIAEDVYASVNEQIQSGYSPGGIDRSATRDSVVVALATDRAFSAATDVQDELRKAVKTQVEKAGIVGVFRPLTRSTETNRAVVFYSAPGSGKTTLIDDVVRRSSGDVAVIDKSIYRRMLIRDFTSAIVAFKSYMPVTQDEITGVFAQAVNAYCALVNEGEGTPAIVFELANLGDQVLFDQVVAAHRAAHRPAPYTYFIHTTAELALDRALSRSLKATRPSDDGKLMPTAHLIKLHRDVSIAFEAVLSEHAGTSLRFELLDNRASKIEHRQVIAFGDAYASEIKVLDYQAFCEYLEKRYLNVSAMSISELRSGVNTAEEITRAVLALSLKYTIGLVDKRTDTVYAAIAGAAVTVHDPAMFRSHIQESDPLRVHCTINVPASQRLIFTETGDLRIDKSGSNGIYH